MGDIIYFSDHIDKFNRIEPLVREVCFAASLSPQLADEVIAEYKSYFEQLALLSKDCNMDRAINSEFDAPLNHACHLILGLLIKAKLNP